MKKYKSIELFAGAGGMAIGMENAGFENILLNDFDKYACKTLSFNRPQWNVLHKPIQDINFTEYKNKIDLITGGFPCQAFSYAGKQLGFSDTRGTLFHEFARSLLEVNPTVFLAENVKGLLTHDKGNTIKTILNTFSDLGYHVFPVFILNSNFYNVAQKRERLIIFGVKKEYSSYITWEEPIKHKTINIRDVFYKGNFYNCDIEELKDTYTYYSDNKKKWFNKIPEGGNWKNLSIDEQKEYMGKMFYSGGGKTGILNRLSLDKPSNTILTSPSQKQTERCHPLYIRPLSIRESARIQSFPDHWIFQGSISSQYKQIGNAVPCNLAYYLGLHIKDKLDIINNICK